MIARTIFTAALFLLLGELQAQDGRLFWKYKDYDGVAFTLPRTGIDIASWFLDNRDDRVWLRRINKVRVMVFEDVANPVRDRDMRRFNRRAARHHLEDMLLVRDGKTHVRILAKERRNALRKVVFLTQSPEAFVLFSIKGKVRWDDLLKAMNKFNHENNKPEKPLIPSVIRA
ncbi:MAG: DUF4252 domain-containing protein [Saprospiraceae bacterium]